MRGMKIGITGSRGFIGRHLTAELKKQKVNLSFFDRPYNDLLAPSASLKKFVAKNDIIIHAAAINRGADPEIIAGSVVATHNLITALIKIKSKAKIVFLSSVQAENQSVFGLSKKLTETMLKSFSESNKSPVSVLRLTNVFGEGCKPFYNSVVATFCHKIANNQKIQILDGSKKICFIYVRDAVRAIIKETLIKRKKFFNLKTVSSKNEIAVKELADLIHSFKKSKKMPKIRSKFQKDLYRTYLSYESR